MAKQQRKVRARRDRANYLDGGGRSKYARKQAGFGTTHDKHLVRVLSCSLCRPGAPLAKASLDEQRKDAQQQQGRADEQREAVAVSA